MPIQEEIQLTGSIRAVWTTVAAIVIKLRQRDPAFAPLTLNEGLGSLALRIERVKLLIEAFLGRFPSVDRAPQARGRWPGDLRVLLTFSHGVAPCAPGAREIYKGFKSLADLCMACLRSVDQAWLSPTEIAERLISAHVVTPSRSLTGHIGTALSRRMTSRVSPNPELERDKGRFRLRLAKAAHAEAIN